MAQPPIVPPQPAPAAPKGNGPATDSDTKDDAKEGPRALEGKTEIDAKLTIECELLAHRAASIVAAAIAAELLAWRTGDLTVVLLEQPDHAALHLRQSFVLQLRWLADGFRRAEALLAGSETATPAESAPGTVDVFEKKKTLGAVTPVVTAAVAAAGPLLEFLGLFRQDVAYHGRQVTVTQKAFLLELARHLRAAADTRNVHVTYPRLALFALGTTEPPSSERIRNRLEPVLQARARVEAAVAEAARDVAGREQEIAERLKQKKTAALPDGGEGDVESDVRDVLDRRLKMEYARRALETSETQLTAMWTALQTPDAKTGRTGLQLLHEAEELRARFQSQNTLLLHAEVVSAGGSYKVTRNLWRTLFWGDGLRYSGGVVVTFAALDAEANVVRSGTYRYLQPHVRFPPAWRALTSVNSPDVERFDRPVS